MLFLNIFHRDEYPYTYAEALEMMTSHLRDFKEEELQYLKEIGVADWMYIDGEVHFQRLFYDNLTQTRPDLAATTVIHEKCSKFGIRKYFTPSMAPGRTPFSRKTWTVI